MTPIAVVTGVAGGVGAATAKALASCGWDVIGVDRREPAADIPLKDVLQADIGMPEGLELVSRTIRALTSLDAVVNNAAVAVDRSLLDVTPEEWDNAMAVNARSALFIVQAAFHALAEAKGAVVNVASVHALATARNVSVYAATKGALVALTRALAIELAPHRVRVNAVLPGAVDTEMLRAGADRSGQRASAADALKSLAARTPLGTIGTPEEIAESIVFLADGRRSGFITGQALVIDGGATAQLSTEA